MGRKEGFNLTEVCRKDAAFLEKGDSGAGYKDFAGPGDGRELCIHLFKDIY